VGVRPDHRSRGLGRELYGTFFEEARRRRCLTVRAIIPLVNAGSVGFHTSMGFEIFEGDGAAGGVGVLHHYDGDRKDKVVFAKEIGLSPTPSTETPPLKADR
jgi:GNAT superfamily N-acetyltransferase